MIDEYNVILASPERQRTIVSEELAEIVDKFGDDRRTKIVPFDGDMSMEDLIPEEDVVVTITRGGYAKRTKVDLYRSQKRGGKGVRGAQLRGDDIVEHFFTTTTHHWLLFFTNLGRVYRAKAYELPEGGRDAKGQHVANLLAFQPGEQIAQVLDLRDYVSRPLPACWPPVDGLVKKTRLVGVRLQPHRRPDRDQPARGRRAGRRRAARPRPDDLLLVSRQGPVGAVHRHRRRRCARWAGPRRGVTGHEVPRRRPPAVDERGPRRRGPRRVRGLRERPGQADARRRPTRSRAAATLGVKVAKISERGGDLVGALTVAEDDEVMVVMEKGKIVRSRVDEVHRTSRNTMGVQFAKPDNGDAIVAVARNAEKVGEAEVEELVTGEAETDRVTDGPAPAG